MIPLITRSFYSLMRGTASPAALCLGAKQRGFNKIALTDRDNLYGLWPFLHACEREGIMPIIGAEITDPETDEALGIPQRSLRRWKDGKASPKPLMAYAILARIKADAWDAQVDEGGTDMALKRHFAEVVAVIQAADKKTYAATKLDAISHVWRRIAVDALRVVDPDAYAKYRRLKYGKGQTPDLATRRRAYEFAIKRFLELSYNLPGF